MGVTVTTLFRIGNATNATMDNVRPIDINFFIAGGDTWVRAGTGGISTFATRGTRPGRWWRLDQGYDYGVLIIVWNDHAQHWSWEPIRDMKLDDYKAALRASHLSFVRS